MKRVCITSALFFWALIAFAQQNVVKANPLGLIFGSAELGYERVLNDSNSVEIALAYSRQDATLNNETVKATGFGVEGKYKAYFSKNKSAPRGWYGAPVVTYVNSKAKSESSSSALSLFLQGD